MSNITIRFSLGAVLGLFSAMILLGALLGLYSLSDANRTTKNTERITAQVVEINEAYKEIMRTRTSFLRGLGALTQNDDKAAQSGLKRGNEYIDSVVQHLDLFAKLPAFDGQDEAVRSAMIESGKKMAAALSKGSEALGRGDVAGFVAINGKDIVDGGAVVSKQLAEFQEVANKLTSAAQAGRDANFAMVSWLVGGGLCAALMLVVGTHVMLKRVVIAPLDRAVHLLEQVALGDLTMSVPTQGTNEIGLLFGAVARMQQGLLATVSQVRSGSDQINTGAQEIAAGNMDLSARTETQASSLEETAASMEELTGTVRQNADNALQANQLVQAASVTALKGGDVMRQMVGTMTDINDSSRKIVDIISVIDGIAFQTNILALNAAVEAARAGEQGRGFAVVATEVRNLAQRSAAAAKEIKGLIDDSVGKVDSGSKLVEQAGDTMNEVVASVQKVTDIVSEIAAASREQRAGIEQVNQAITQMDAVTQQNAALVEQAAAAAQSMQDQAGALAETVAFFRVDAGQSTRPVAAQPVRPASRQLATRASVKPAKTAASHHTSEWEEV